MERIRRVAVVAVLACLTCASTASAARKAPPAYEPHTVIVKYAPGSSASQTSLAGRLAGVLDRVGRIARTGASVVRVAGDPAKVAARLNRSRSVLYAEPNYIMRPVAAQIPNDGRFGELYNLRNTGQGGGTPGADIDAPEGWGMRTNLIGFPASNGGVKIGIVDTGIMLGHEDFAGRAIECAGVRSTGLFVLELFADPTIVPGQCADDNGHGSHVAGIIGARANNGVGVTGVAFDSPLAVCKSGGGIFGGSPVAGVANCITWLSQRGAKIISMSLGGLTRSAALDAAIVAASEKSLLISAAGNDNSPNLSYPGGYPEVVSVAATDRNDARASFSNYNDDVELSAPGVDVLSTMKDGTYILLSGTSMATPHVSAVAALIAARGGTPADWRARLHRSVDDLGAPGRDPQFGFGRINLAKALAP